MHRVSYLTYTLLAGLGLYLSSCAVDDDVPAAENAEEVITEVVLTFTPDSGSPVTATWEDSDGEGSGAPVLTDINLAANTPYSLTISMVNGLDPDNVEDISGEVEEEADEHMLFFGWTDGIFSDPAGDGNIDNRSDAVNYEDQDENGQPLGLQSRWTTGEASTGTFRVVLKHQPNSKSATSTVDDGASDVNITWDITVE